MPTKLAILARVDDSSLMAASGSDKRFSEIEFAETSNNSPLIMRGKTAR